MLAKAQDILLLPHNRFSRIDVGHIIYGDSAKDVGRVDNGIVFAVNPCLSQSHRASGGVFPHDYAITQDWGWILGAKANAPNHGVSFRLQANSLHLQYEQAKGRLLHNDAGQVKPSDIMHAESKTLVPMGMAAKLQGVFRGIPDAAFDSDYLHLLKDTSIGCAIAAARYAGCRAVVISGLPALFTARNPKPALKLRDWFDKVQPSWLYTFTPLLEIPEMRVYVHPAQQAVPAGVKHTTRKRQHA